MKTNLIGNFKHQPGGFDAFIPFPFPPKDGFDFDTTIYRKNDEATRLLGKLDGITQLLPDIDFFLLMYLRKDAAASSQIEGTKATLMNAIEAEVSSGEKIPPDVDDIFHYIKALQYGLKRVREDNFPLSLRFIRELHRELMQGARASQFPDPGEFRTSQNWIDGTRPDNARYVPPPVDDMKGALGDLENFIHAKDSTPVVIKAGLIHAQFEIIHPFLDGNGRTGRMLISFFLWKAGYLELPVLYLSAYFKKHKDIYLNRLEDYHNGLVNNWIIFFLDGVIEIAKEAIITVEKITTLRERDWSIIRMLGKRSAEISGKVLPKLYAQPIVSITTIQKWTGYTHAGAQKVIDKLITEKILYRKDEDKKYGQLYQYSDYLKIFTG